MSETAFLIREVKSKLLNGSMRITGGINIYRKNSGRAENFASFLGAACIEALKRTSQQDY